MGRGALGLLLSVGPVIMKVLWVTLLVVLVLFVQSEAKKKPKPKPKPGCLKDDEKLQIKKGLGYKYDKFTETKKVKGKDVPVANQPCWWDLRRTDCALCKSNGAQCGFPMHKWCQDKKKAKKEGCKGITQPKYTKSMTGYPCYWDPKRTDCAWCLPGKIQCKEKKKNAEASAKNLLTRPATECLAHVEIFQNVGLEPSVTRRVRNANVTRGCLGMASSALIKKEKQLPTQVAMLIFQLSLQASSLYSPMVAQSSQLLSKMMTNHPTKLSWF